MSKSIVNRMLILAPERTLALLTAESELCDDLKVMAAAVKTVRRENTKSDIVTINLHASGTAMRFITALCAVTEGEWLLTGTERLCERPIAPLVNALRQAGAKIEYKKNDGFPPLVVCCHGKPEGGQVEIDGSESSQYISALMLVADRFKKKLNIHIKGKATSVPYIEMTRRLIHEWRQGREMMPEPDWSAAAFWFEIKYLMRRLTGFNPEGIRLTGLKDDSIQGDRTVRDIFEEMERNEGIFEWDFRNCPDLVQPVVVSCCMTGKPFRVTGVSNLRLKETDRIEALRRELAKMGMNVCVCDKGDGLRSADISEARQKQGQDTIQEQGQELNREPVVDTYKDHRMAMAFAGCALKWGKVVINEPEVVEKSYPGFWKALREAGFGVSMAV